MFLSIKPMRKKGKIILPLLLFLLVFTIYFHNLSASVYGGDVGDFLSAIATRGVPHPSGYPLFTLLGIISSFLPFQQTLAWKVGLISVFSASLGVVLMYGIVFELLKNRILGFITALTLAFTYPFWIYAEVSEVFALTYLFILLLLFLAIIYYKRKKLVFLYLLSFFSGLSLTNHEISVLIFPSLFLLVIATNWKIIFKLKAIMLCISLFLLGLLPYLYVPFAALRSPAINWDNAVNLSNFLHLVLRKDYGWQFTEALNIQNRLSAFAAYCLYWLLEFPAIIPIASIIGIYAMLRRNVLVCSSVFLSFILTGLFFIYYANTPVTDIFRFGMYERFYVISGIFFLIFLPFGIQFVIKITMQLLVRISPVFSQRKHYKTFFQMLFFVIPLVLFYKNIVKTDLHDVWLGDYLAEDTLSVLPANSSVYLSGDTVVFNALYVYHAKSVRRDVRIHASSLMDYGDKQFSDIYARVVGNNKNLSQKTAYLLAVLELSKHKAYFSELPLQFEDKKYRKPLLWIPYGFVYKLADTKDKEMTKEEYLALQENIWEKFHLSELKINKEAIQYSLILSAISLNYVQAAINTGNYLRTHYNDDESAGIYYQKAIDVNSQVEAGYEGMGIIYLDKKDCVNAKKYFSRMVKVNYWSKSGYVWLYKTNRNCFKDDKKTKKISETYLSIFGKKIEDSAVNIK